MKVSDMLDVLSSQGDFKTNRMLFESSLYYYGSILLNIANIKKIDGGRINYYGISFAGSGSGKDFALSTVANAVGIDDVEYVRAMRESLTSNVKRSADPKYIEDLATHVPLGHTIGLDGTREGIFRAASSQSVSNYGSFNVGASEFGDIINNSSDLLAALKELYDGSYKAKVIKSENVAPIKDITVNLMAFGSHAGLDVQARKEFNKLATSGMYRRSFIIDVKPSEILLNSEPMDLEPVHNHLYELRERCVVQHKVGMAAHKANVAECPIKITDGAKSIVLGAKEYLIDQANKDIHNEITAAERGAFTMIENLAYIICFLEGRGTVEDTDVSQAWDFYTRCRETTEGIFKQKSDFHVMYEMIKSSEGLAVSDLIPFLSKDVQTKSKFEEQLDLLEEYCYINGETLTSSGSKVKRYKITDLPKNDNTKLIVGICIDNKGDKSVDYAPMEVPLFGENNSMEALVQSTDPQSFTLAHYEPSKQAINGHRRAESFISGQNVIGFDIDDSMSLSEAIELMKPYTYLIYTTKSHQKEKNGKVLDRFRIILPTKTTFYVDEEQHKELYDNIAEVLGIQIYDRQTRNVSRFWFTSPSCEIFTNVAENIDVTATLPETAANKKFIENMDYLAANYDTRTNESIRGFTKWFFANTGAGNRSDHLFRLGKFMKDLGEDAAKYIEDFNAMLDDPLKGSELSNIIKSVQR